LCEYWGNAQATADALRAGWYVSGDLGSRDADGHFFIHDRKKNLIISGGENIYPAEVERVLASHPALSDAAVVGRPDARWQEVPVAFVIRRAGAAVTCQELQAFCHEQLARYKVPRDIVFVDTLPRNAMGKVQHFRLKQLLGAEVAAAEMATPAAITQADPPQRFWRWPFSTKH
jgi:fatty-acyl-CoA synthase